MDAARTRDRNRADRLWSKYILLRDRRTCQRCLKSGNQPHHIFSKRHLGTRHDPENGICLCVYCHRTIAHSDYETFREFIVGRMGERAYTLLRVRSQTITKADYVMAQIVLKMLIKQEEKAQEGRHELLQA